MITLTPHHPGAAPARVVALLLLAACATTGQPTAASGSAAPGQPSTLPSSLLPNVGQWPEQVLFGAQVPAGRLWVERSAIVTETPIAPGACRTVRLEVRDADPGTVASGEAAPPGLYGLALGDDRPWRTSLDGYDTVRFAGVRPGIDWLVTTAGCSAEHVIELQPHARLDELEFTCQGITGMHLLADGALVLEAPGRDLIQPPPRGWRLDGAERLPLTLRYEPTGPTTFRFTSREPRDVVADAR